MQSDCQKVVHTTKDGGYSTTAAAPIYQDIMIQATSFDKISYFYCPRESKLLARILAREAEDQPNVWVDDPPSFIIQNMIDDVIVI